MKLKGVRVNKALDLTYFMRIRGEDGKLRDLTVDERIYLRGIDPYWWFKKPFRLDGLTTTLNWHV